MSNKWVEYVNQRTIKFEDVPKLIQPNWSVNVACLPIQTSNEIYDAIVDYADNLVNVHIGEGVCLLPNKFADLEENIKVYKNLKGRTGFALGPLQRNLYKNKLKDSVHVQACDSGEGFAAITDMWLLHVARPDEFGFCNYSLMDFMQSSGVEHGKKFGTTKCIVAEINDKLPNVYGNSRIHVSDIDYFIPISRDPFVMPPLPPPTPEDLSMANYVAPLVNDGDTLQIGIGPVPETVASLLDGKHDLGISTEMLATCHMDMIEKGIVTNLKKPFYKGISVYSFCLGNEKLYQYIHENPAVQVVTAREVANPVFIAQHPGFKAINSALLIDLSGQSSCEGIGHRMISGIGGQLNFQMGARWSEGGRAIQLFRAANPKSGGGIESCIVSELPAGTPVSVPRAFADIAVTEYGVADLRYKTTRMRADALIAIAHPDVRGELRKAARRNFYPSFDQEVE